ncbi:MAG TPA: hypothetical protein VLN25_02820 [Burkholderiaceae bacterium]|nr:hypothetical protein [Burkholderiaceae bacterium]
MTWRTRPEETSNVLGAWALEVLNDLRLEWRCRPLIRHLSALALCLVVVLVGVLERSTKRTSFATTVTRPGVAVAEQRAPARDLSRAEPPARRQ